MFSLVQPTFDQEVGGSFLEAEAGISCYVNVGEEINLAEAKPLFKVLEDETENYLIGTVELTGYGEDWWPHVWIHKDGWIVVYYLKDEPTSRLMDWNTFAQTSGEEIGPSNLENLLLSVANALKLDLTRIKVDLHYYHWQYPQAKKILVVVDTTNSGSDSFSYTIPGSLKVYEVSGSHCGSVSTYWGQNWSGTTIDDAWFEKGGQGTYILVDMVPAKYTAQGVTHNVKFTA